MTTRVAGAVKWEGKAPNRREISMVADKYCEKCATEGNPYKSESTIVGVSIGQALAGRVPVAFLQFADVLQGGAAVEQRSIVIAIYTLCTFANFGSIAMTIAGIGEIAPSRRKDLARLGLKAMFAGLLASLATAAIAGVLV